MSKAYKRSESITRNLSNTIVKAQIPNIGKYCQKRGLVYESDSIDSLYHPMNFKR
jgi:hypothetical protein